MENNKIVETKPTRKSAALTKGLLVLAGAALLVGGAVAARAESVPAAGGQPFHKGFFGRSGSGQALSDEQRAEMKTTMEARRAEMETRQAAVKDAMDKGDYQAWLNAVGTDSPMAAKIKDAASFTKLVQAHNLRMQADNIFKELGIDGQAGPHFRGGPKTIN